MIITKETILKILSEEYKKQNSQISDKKLKFQIAELSNFFCRSFEYKLSQENNIKSKCINLIKRIICKFARLLMSPYAEQNLKFQESVCKLCGAISDRLQTITNIVDEQNIEIEKLKKEIFAIKK